MNQHQNSELTRAKAAKSAEQKKTTPPTSQTKSNIQTKKAIVNTLQGKDLLFCLL
jgi:hypothetical protein